MGQVTIIEVGPRDGLQNEKEFVPTEKKVELIRKLSETGLQRIEATSYVHPKWVPQMADADSVMGAMGNEQNISFGVLIPNKKGYERAIQYRVDEINWVTAATKTFNAKNINQSMDENLAAFRWIVPLAKARGIKVRFSIAVSFGCPYEGRVAQEAVYFLVKQGFELGADEVGIADTIGVAVPDQVFQLCSQLLDFLPPNTLALHLHDTRGMALANTYAAYTAGVRIFETAIAGLGGCPFAPGAAGNVATEDVVYMFERMKIQTGINLSELLDVSDYAVSLSKRKALGKIRSLEDRSKLFI